MHDFLYFLGAVAFWLLGWFVVLGMAWLCRPLHLLDRDDILAP